MTMMRTKLTLDESQMARLAKAIAPALSAGMRVYFQGELGAGKTTLVRALVRALGHAGPVKSPTYGLIEPYELAIGKLCHLDLYRLADPEELEYLGLRDLLEEQTLLLVEWPERGGELLPAPDLLIKLSHQAERRGLELVASTVAGSGVVENWLAVQSLFN